ncbi:hypothetical protein Lesp02_60800 [Lentzea sp. NBRC 105346]|uniref:hypothetical protein n=1 Tax=Lentzea sp. NBRC 105346 TaxID=3032205 RepID=UPI00255435A3|nr:hypothetical protein [Lentzea sp. NBRC 105346]GLZ33892.1 hypothetical protein Lesp02_60800 [Lentzea sp. NBRC 105346]
MTRAELVRLCRCAVRRPRWQLVLAALLSVWTLAWVLGQLGREPLSPLDLVAWTGIPLEAASSWARDRADVLIWCATLGGLSWAATTERAQLPALAGWLAVLVAGEAAGYEPAVHRAMLSMGVFLLVLALVSVTGRRAFVVDRIAVMPRDVLRAGVTAAVLTAIVPLLAPGLAVTRLVRPYVTKPPRLRRVEPPPLRETG